MPSRSGGRYEVRDGEPVLVERTDGPQLNATPKPTRAPSASAEVAPTTEEDTDDADA